MCPQGGKVDLPLTSILFQYPALFQVDINYYFVFSLRRNQRQINCSCNSNNFSNKSQTRLTPTAWHPQSHRGQTFLPHPHLRPRPLRPHPRQTRCLCTLKSKLTHNITNILLRPLRPRCKGKTTIITTERLITSPRPDRRGRWEPHRHLSAIVSLTFTLTPPTNNTLSHPSFPIICITL